jgi:methylthioribose-1-phosphate isomerase
VLDETLLPQKISYIRMRDYKDSCKVIRQMKTRAVGQVLVVMYTFLLTVQQHKREIGLVPVLTKIALALNAARPTLPFKVLTDMVLSWARQGAPLERTITGFLEMLKATRIQQAREAAEALDDGDCVLTHCNVSGLMPLIGEFCRSKGKRITFFVTETRPYLQGLRLSAWELTRAGFDTTVITDSSVAAVMKSGKISKVIVGADHRAQNGDIANKIGTYQIALLARHFRIPFYVLCPPASKAPTGKDITIEIRPGKELLQYYRPNLVRLGTKLYYPAFDVTPAELITRHFDLELKGRL